MPSNDSFTTTRPTIVLKLGGSVLARESDIPAAVHECYRWSRAGYRVLAVVSAIGDATDRLVASASAYGHAPAASAYAALVATGELTSAAHTWLGCDAAGLDAVALDPRDIGLLVRGSAVDAEPVSVRRDALERALERHAVVVVPGFVGIDAEGRPALLGRGGSDLTAIVLAAALGARCRLVKDVPGLYERDPARPGPFARRYERVTFRDAERLDGAILQRKALRYAIDRDLRFEVGALARAECTLVGAESTRFAIERPTARRRIALLGFGVVGRGVWRHIAHDQARGGGRFETVGVAVRQPKRHADVIAPRLLVTDALALARSADRDGITGPDLVIETIGGTDLAYECAAAALSRGADLVTANKSLLARHGEELAAIAAANGARIACSAAVGGAAPCLEAIERLRPRGIRRLDGILNGTTNFILGRLAEGVAFGEALGEAQALGFAESDPSSDLDGIDAAEKLVLLCRSAFGAEPASIGRESIRSLGAVRPGTKLVASAWRTSEGIAASVRPVELDGADPLARTDDEWNRLRITLDAGETVEVSGKGAGRWPTAEAAYADVLDLWRLRQPSGRPAGQPWDPSCGASPSDGILQEAEHA